MLENLQVNSYDFENYTELNDNLLYLDYIKHNYKFEEITIQPILRHRYQGNFFGLLREINNVSPSLYLYTLYINNLTSPTDYNENSSLVIKIPIKPPISK
jgi:hypothetical protein